MSAPAELPVVSRDEVGQPRPVARQLRAGFRAIQIRADILALDMAYRHATACDDEIRRAASNVRLIWDCDMELQCSAEIRCSGRNLMTR